MGDALDKRLARWRRRIASLLLDNDQKIVAKTTLRLVQSYWYLVLMIFCLNLVAALFEGGTITIFGLSIKVLIGDQETSFAQLIGPIGIYIDRWISIDNRETMFLVMVFAALGTVLFKVTSTFAANVGTAQLKVVVFKNVWNSIFKQFMTMAFSQISQYKAGDLHRYIQDAEGISSWIQHLNRMLETVLTLMIYTVMLFLLSWNMSLIAILLLGMISFLINGLIKRIRKLAKSLVPIGVEQNVRCLEFISSIRLLRVFSREKHAVEQMESIVDIYQTQIFWKTVWTVLIKPVMQLSSVLAVTAIILLSYYMFMETRDHSIWPRLLTFLLVLNRMGPTVTQFNNRRAEIHNAYPQVLRVNNMLRTDNKMYISDGDREFRGFRGAIEFRDVSLTYTEGERPAIEDLSMIIPMGKMVAFVGESGAGKSSTIDLLLRLFDPTKGNILVDNINLRNFKVKSWRERIGVVNQENFIFNASIRDNLLFGKLNATEDEVVRAAKTANADDFILKLQDGYDTIIGDRGYRLSGGQRQRLAIARAIIRDPDILVLDEATSSLDSHSERKIQEAVNNLRTNRTVIAVAHRLSTISMADRIFVLHNGRLAEEGTHSELLKRNGYYAKLWRSQSGRYDEVRDTYNPNLAGGGKC